MKSRQLTSFVWFPSAWWHAIHLLADCSIPHLLNHFPRRSRLPPTTSSLNWLRQHESDANSLGRLQPSYLSWDCTLHIRCVWQRVNPRRPRRRMASSLRAFAPVCAATRESFAAPATNDTSSLLARVLCTVGSRAQAARCQRSPWETPGWVAANERWKSIPRCAFCGPSNHAWSSWERPWKPSPRCLCSVGSSISSPEPVGKENDALMEEATNRVMRSNF